MTVLERPDPQALLGVPLHAGMKIDVFGTLLAQGLENNPTLQAAFEAPMLLVTAATELQGVVMEKMQIIMDIQEDLTTAQQVLRLASKVFDVASNGYTTGLTTGLGAIPGPVIGSALGGVMAPLQVIVTSGLTALNTAITAIEQVEQLITEAVSALTEMTQTLKHNIDLAIDAVMQKITELGQFYIYIDEIEDTNE